MHDNLFKHRHSLKLFPVAQKRFMQKATVLGFSCKWSSLRIGASG